MIHILANINLQEPSDNETKLSVLIQDSQTKQNLGKIATVVISLNGNQEETSKVHGTTTANLPDGVYTITVSLQDYYTFTRKIDINCDPSKTGSCSLPIIVPITKV